MKILIADHNDKDYNKLAKILHNHEIMRCFNGHTAKTMADHYDFDIAFLEAHLPLFSGYYALQTMREQFKIEYPIYLMGNIKNHKTVQDAYELGATAWINKPVGENYIRKIIRGLE